MEILFIASPTRSLPLPVLYSPTHNATFFAVNMNKVNLLQKFSLIHDHWNPRIVGELNGQYLKLVKFQGPFTWHHHENEDELFLVVKGRFRMDYRADGRDR